MTVRIPAASLVMATCSRPHGVRQVNSVADGVVCDGIVCDGIVCDGRGPRTAAVGRAVGPRAAATTQCRSVGGSGPLPVGGGGSSRTIPAAWSCSGGAGSIPEGVRIMITGLEVKGKNGADIHTASGVSCQPPCHDYMFAAGGSCQVAVGWTPNHPPNDLIGTIGLGGKCVAPDEPTCDQMKATVKSETGPLAEIKVLAQTHLQ
jgi:hypothetical protein